MIRRPNAAYFRAATEKKRMRSPFRDKLKDLLGFIALVLMIGVAFLPTPAAFALDVVGDQAVMNEISNFTSPERIADETRTLSVSPNHDQRILKSPAFGFAAALHERPAVASKNEHRSKRNGWDDPRSAFMPTSDAKPFYRGIPSARQGGGPCIGGRDSLGAGGPRDEDDARGGQVEPPGRRVLIA